MKSTTPPTSAADVLELLANGLRVKKSWKEVDRVALRRWVAGKEPGVAIQQRLALRIVQGALRPTVTRGVDDVLRRELIEAAAEGLLRAAQHFETSNRSGWMYALATTMAVVARFFDVQLLIRQGEQGAVAPDWLFSWKGLRRSHAVIARLQDTLRDDNEEDNRLRKNLAALRAGRSQQATHDELQTLLRKRHHRRALAMPLTFELLIEQLVVDLDIDMRARVLLLTVAENARARLGTVSKDELIVALRGHLFRTWNVATGGPAPTSLATGHKNDPCDTDETVIVGATAEASGRAVASGAMPVNDADG